MEWLSMYQLSIDEEKKEEDEDTKRQNKANISLKIEIKYINRTNETQIDSFAKIFISHDVGDKFYLNHHRHSMMWDNHWMNQVVQVELDFEIDFLLVEDSTVERIDSDKEHNTYSDHRWFDWHRWQD